MIRSRILAIFTALAVNAAPAGVDHGFGPVTPVELPDVMVTRHDGAQLHLREVLRGRHSAVQFIFVDCATACPLLGSLFAKVDRSLTDGDRQLVSITVNPRRDTPQRLAQWLGSYRASRNWIGLQIDPEPLARLFQAFRLTSGEPSGHTLQIFLVDPSARYVARTVDMPPASSIVRELQSSEHAVDETRRVGMAQGTGREYFDGTIPLDASIGRDRIAPQAARCSGCHGATGDGGGEGKTSVPDLHSLAATIPRRGGPPSRYTLTTFCQTLRTGVDPAGVRLSAIMPVYDLDSRTCSALWGYLTKEP